jgi:hypothetical protein
MLPSEIIITTQDGLDYKYKIIFIHISNDVIIYFMYHSRYDFKYEIFYHDSFYKRNYKGSVYYITKKDFENIDRNKIIDELNIHKKQGGTLLIKRNIVLFTGSQGETVEFSKKDFLHLLQSF